MTLIIGKRCSDGVVLAADRRGLRDYEPNEEGKIRPIKISAEGYESSVLLAGAGVGAFWDEAAWSLEQYLRTEISPKVRSFLDIVSSLSVTSINLSGRYQPGGMDERLGCVLAGFEQLNTGSAKIYYFAGAGFTETNFICLGSGDKYALPMANLLLNIPTITIERAARLMPLIFILVERVNLSVGNGPDIYVLEEGTNITKVGGSITKMESERLNFIKSKSSDVLRMLPDTIDKWLTADAESFN